MHSTLTFPMLEPRNGCTFHVGWVHKIHSVKWVLHWTGSLRHVKFLAQTSNPPPLQSSHGIRSKRRSAPSIPCRGRELRGSWTGLRTRGSWGQSPARAKLDPGTAWPWRAVDLPTIEGLRCGGVGKALRKEHWRWGRVGLELPGPGFSVGI